MGRSAYRDFVGKSERKVPLGTRTFRQEHDIEVDLKEIGLECFDFIYAAQNRASVQRN
jgi:hypothetical protein